MRTHRILALALLLSTACVDLSSAPTASQVFPVITTQPISQVDTLGSPAIFTVVATGDSLTYQWYKGTTLIYGATAPTFTIPSTVGSDAGIYQVVITNTSAAIASDTASLTVVVPANLVGYRLVGGVVTTTNQGYSSTTPNQSAIYASGGAELTLINPTIVKSGNATSASPGTNAAVRVDGGAHVLVTSGRISTDSTGATALYATQGASIEMYGGTISTTGASAYGILATVGANIRVERTAMRTLSDTLARATGSSTVTLLANGDSLSGALVADASSTINATLQNGGKLTGVVQGAAVSIDGTSAWIVTGNSVVTTLTLPAGPVGSTIPYILGNGYNVYYSASLPGNAALLGMTYWLSGGGQLVPR
jgi:hypothetical protein